MRIVRVISFVLCMIIMILTNVVHAESANLLLKVSDVDDGYWVEAYREYLRDFEEECIAEYGDIPRGATLVDLTLDGIPELIIICQTGARATGIGYIVNLADPVIVNGFSYGGSRSTYALCLDSNGELAWYELEETNALTYKEARTYRVSVDDQLNIHSEEWFSVMYEPVFDEATGESEMVAIAYYVDGNEVDYETYRQEEIKRRRLTTVYTFNPYNQYPDGWDEMVANACVFNITKED